MIAVTMLKIAFGFLCTALALLAVAVLRRDRNNEGAMISTALLLLSTAVSFGVAALVLRSLGA